MPFAPTEPPAPTRSLPPNTPTRDRQPAGTGFSSLVDDRTAAKAKASPPPAKSRAAETPANTPPREPKAPDDSGEVNVTEASQPPRETLVSATQTAASDKKAGLAEQIAPQKTDTTPAETPTDPAALLPQIDPNAVSSASVPVPAPAAPVAAPQPPAPLAIAAVGLAAAQSVTARPADPLKPVAGKVAVAAAAASQTPSPEDAVDPGQGPELAPVTVAPAGIDGAAKKALVSDPLGSDTSEANAAAKIQGAAKPDGNPEASLEAKAGPKAVTPTEGQIAAAPTETPKAAPETTTEAAPKAAPKAGPAALPAFDPDASAKPAERHAASSALVSDSAAPAPTIVVPQPAHQAAATAAPNVQLTAAVATAQPVPLNGLAVELAARATTGATRFEIRLDPAELGRIDVRLEIDKHGQVTSHLTVEKPETLAMLRQDSPQLQRALNDAGFKTADGGMQFSLGDPSQSQSQARQQNGETPRHAHRLFIQSDDQPAPVVPIRDYGRLTAARSGVDISV